MTPLMAHQSQCEPINGDRRGEVARVIKDNQEQSMEIGEARWRGQSKLIKSNQGQLRAIKGDRTCPTELTPSEAARAIKAN